MIRNPPTSRITSVTAYAVLALARALHRAEKNPGPSWSRSPLDPMERYEALARGMLRNRAQREREAWEYWQRRGPGPETFVATWNGGSSQPQPSPQAAMAEADRLAPKGVVVRVKGEWTSDGTFHPNHRGRLVSSRNAHRDLGFKDWAYS